MSGAGAGVANGDLGRVVGLRAVGAQAVEGAGAGEVLDLALVDQSGIEALRKVGEAAEAPLGAALRDHRRHGVGTDALQRRQGVADGRLAVIQRLDRKSTRLNSSHYCAPRMPTSDCKNKTLVVNFLA